MPSVYDLKPRFQRLLQPAATALARGGVSPNAVTLAALAGSAAVGVALLFARERPWLLLLIPPWLFLRMALNAIDGMIARQFDRATPAGAVLNEIGDAVSDLMLYLPLAAFSPPALWPAVLFAIGAVLTELCGVAAKAAGGTRRYDGPMGKSDRAFAVSVVAVATVAAPRIARFWPWIFGAGAVLTLVTCAHRLARSFSELRAPR